jgi:hypothetical protein
MGKIFTAMISLALLCSAALTAQAGSAAAWVPSTWSPSTWIDENTIDLRSDCPDEGEHWSPVWLVVLDGELYVSLGSRAAKRFACTTKAPILDVRIDGQEFQGVRFEPAQEFGERIDDARSDKYLTGRLFSFVHHDHYRVVRPVEEVLTSE